MQLVFLGTRGNTDQKSPRHRRHSALLISHHRTCVMIDCGEDWLGRLARIRPDAILLTHAHPDHAWGLENGAPCPVFASDDTWSVIGEYPLVQRRRIVARVPFSIGRLAFEAFAVDHSLRAPALGYRVTANETAFFYVPDVVAIRARHAALAGIAVYVGDGATLTRPMVRRRDRSLFGHTTVRAQLGWCQAEGVPRAIFTHCGDEIVGGDGRTIAAKLRAMARERSVDAVLAHDGLKVALRSRARAGRRAAPD